MVKDLNLWDHAHHSGQLHTPRLDQNIVSCMLSRTWKLPSNHSLLPQVPTQPRILSLVRESLRKKSQQILTRIKFSFAQIRACSTTRQGKESALNRASSPKFGTRKPAQYMHQEGQQAPTRHQVPSSINELMLNKYTAKVSRLHQSHKSYESICDIPTPILAALAESRP